MKFHTLKGCLTSICGACLTPKDQTSGLFSSSASDICQRCGDRCKRRKKTRIEGGFSYGVIETETFRRYAGSKNVGGYIGQSARTKARDAIVEAELRRVGLHFNGVATWLTSGSGRHMMTDVDRKTTAQQFRRRVRNYVEDAFLDVTVWSHPDHRGSLASSGELRQKLRAAINRV